MPDLKISELSPLAGNLLQETDPVAVADLSASETKSLTALQLATGIASMFPAGSISLGAVNLAIGPGSIDTTEIASNAVTDAKLADNSSAVIDTTPPANGRFTGQLYIDTDTNFGSYWNGTVWTDLAFKLVEDSVTAAILANNSSAVIDATSPTTGDFTGQLYIDTATNFGSYWSGTAWTSLTPNIADNAVAASKLANNSSAIIGTAVPTAEFTGQLYIDTTTNYGSYWNGTAWTSLTPNIADNAVAASKLANNSSVVIGTSLPATGNFTGQLYIDTATNFGSYWSGTAWTGLTPQLGTNSVTATELANNSSAIIGTTVPTAEFTGQFRIDTATNEGYYWDGSVWTGFRGEAAVGSIATGTGSVAITPVAGTTAGEIKLDTAFTSSTAAAQFIAGPTASAGTVSYRSIIGADLPTAGTAKGAVAVSGNGLRMDGETLEIDNLITASTSFGVTQVNVNGLVTDHRVITGDDLPIPTTTTVGAVMIGDGIAISSTGSISLDEQSGVTPADYTKVTVNDRGIVTAGANLAAADIPDLSAAKLTSGYVNPQRIDSHTIEREKLAPYSIAFIQEASPATDDATLFAGCLWFQESTAQLRMWNANAWTSVGFGRLAADNLRFGGTISATSGDITGVTSAGITAGLTIGTDLPVATDGLGGLYLVVDEAGSNINVTSGYSYDPGDWVLCISEDAGWVRIDTLSGGGGGGSDTLAGLLDTLITVPTEGDVLVYGSNALWTNEATLSGGVY